MEPACIATTQRSALEVSRFKREKRRSWCFWFIIKHLIGERNLALSSTKGPRVVEFSSHCMGLPGGLQTVVCCSCVVSDGLPLSDVWESHCPPIRSLHCAPLRLGSSACYLALRFCRTPYTFSSLLSPSKNGSRSNSSVSVMSSNHDCTGTYEENMNLLIWIHIRVKY